MVIVDEMAYVPHKPFAKVILPIMVKKGSIMIGISTYGEPNNFFTKLLSQKAPDGTPMFRQIEYSTICRRCLEKGVKKVCQHRRGELPHWHDEHEYEQIFEMLKDDPDIALMELGGVSADSSVQPYFSKHMLMELKRMKTNSGINFIVDLKGRIFNTVYITIDPCGQGTHSDYAILSAVYSENEMIVRIILYVNPIRSAQRHYHHHSHHIHNHIHYLRFQAVPFSVHLYQCLAIAFVLLFLVLVSQFLILLYALHMESSHTTLL